MAERVAYLDRLKLLLTVLVVLHHTAITYGGAGDWYYVEQGGSVAAEGLLTLFTAVNQSFFMGMFFFVSGWLTPASYDRKGGARFMGERFVRFGLPLAIFMLAADPLLWYVSSGYEGSLQEFLRTWLPARPFAGFTEFEPGPLWFLVALLMFNGMYALYRLLLRHVPIKGTLPAFTPELLAGYLATVACANFFIRLILPVGETVLSLQLAYFPAYLGLYMGGIAAYRGGWLDQLSAAGARKWLRAVLGLLVLLPAVMAAGGALEGNTDAFRGGLTWQSLFYSAVDPVLGLGISYVLLVRFRDSESEKRVNGDRYFRYSRWLSSHAFAVYLLHALIVTYVSYALRGWELHPLLKFLLAGCIVLPVCFGIAGLFRRIPGAKRVL